MTLGSNVSPRGFAQRLTENGAANQHPSARYFPQAATSQPRAPYRGHGGLAQQPRLGYVASVATRANNAMVCFCRILLQKSAAVDWAAVPFPRRERRLCRTGPDAFTQLRCYAMRMRHVSRAAASGARKAAIPNVGCVGMAEDGICRSKGALDAARRKHEKNAADIQAQIEALEERSRAEIAHWEKEKARLEAALRRARGG